MCGPNAYCTKDKEESLDCDCPNGYVFVDEQNKYKGCRPNFVPHTCDGKENSSEFMTMEVPYTSWSNQSTYKKFMLTSTTTLEQCNSSCLKDCFCAAVLIDGSSCMFMGMLTAGKVTQDTSTTALIKIRANTSGPVPDPLPVPASVRSIWFYITIGIAVLLSASVLYILWQINISKMAKRNQPGLRIFTSKELKRATKNFKTQLGKGSFGEVYKGKLSYLNPPHVAVKKLVGSNEYSEKDFENEVRSIGQIHHYNLVRMIGYCKEGVHRMLVFEYMQGGTLADFITQSERPRWNLLAEAAIGIAKGLEYLHEGCKPKIMHCDIKPDNILFDDKHIPKITDFGISKLLGDQMTQQTFTNTIAGTKPYIAPEWLDNEGTVGSKVDVYSFGVVLLEMIYCKRAKGKQSPPKDEDPRIMFCLSESESLIRCGRFEELMQGESVELADMESVKRFSHVAIWCLQKDSSMRPTMHKVVQMLEGVVKVDPLPDPTMSSIFSPMHSTSSETNPSSSTIHTIKVE
jgi:hypothetical protein